MASEEAPIWESAFEGVDEAYVPSALEIRRKPSGNQDQGYKDEND
jgi:hypothetical protein